MTLAKTFRRSLAAAAILALAACTAVPQAPIPAPAPIPRPQPRPVLPPPAPSTWMDYPQTPGDWSYRAVPGGSQATFDGVFTLTCDVPSRRITLARSAASPQPTTMHVLTEATQRTLPALPGGGIALTAVATLAASDPLLDAMAFSRGRFAVESPGVATLYLPSWPEVSRVIEDCR